MKNVLLVAAGICAGLAIYHFALKKELPKRECLSAMPWVSYDLGELDKSNTFIEELLNSLED